MATDTKTPAISVEFMTGTDFLPYGVKFTSADGHERTILLSDLTTEMRTMSMAHGVKQKIVDAAAIARNPDTGRSATILDKWDALTAVADRLISGTWNKGRADGTSNVGGLLLRALVRMYVGKKTEDQLRDYLTAKTAEERASLRKNPKVAAIILAIQAEDLAAKGTPDDSDDQLADLDN